MGMTVAAMKAKLGSTQYFILSMKAKELVEKASIPSEMEGWDDETLEEREQREINYNRVKKEIAPYLAKDKDRFFGAIILAARNFNPKNFESLSDAAKGGMHNLNRVVADSMGFLTFTGGEVLVPLDGQHRLKAIQFAIDGKDQASNPIPNLDPCPDLGNEDVTVILVPYEKDKSRKIFTRVNRYARALTTGQNLVTDDEDFVAVSARWVADNMIGGDLVKTKGNILGDSESYFTTLSTIAESNRAIIEIHFSEHAPKPKAFIVDDASRRDMFLGQIEKTWGHMLKNVECFSVMLADKTRGGNERRQEIRRDYLLGKPTPQFCVFRAFSKLVTTSNFSMKKASDALNEIDWRKNHRLWDRLLVSGNKILTKNAKVAADIIYYRAGGKMSEEKKEALLLAYKKVFPENEWEDVKLPPKVSSKS